MVAPELDEVVRLAKPKYHFVGGAGVFWEREPFMYSNADGGGACRAISLGEMGNPSKERVSSDDYADMDEALISAGLTDSGSMPFRLRPEPLLVLDRPMRLLRRTTLSFKEPAASRAG